MQPTLLANGRLHLQDPSGIIHDIGPEHPDYLRWIARSQLPPQRDWTRARLFGLLMIAIGVAAWWYNSHLATEGHFYIKLTILGPLGIFGGLLMLVRPDWAGPVRKDSTKTHKTALLAVIGLMVAASGLDMYRLNGFRFQRQTPPLSGPPRSAWSPNLATSASADAGFAFLGKTYHLGSYTQKVAPQWEFVASGETVDNWTTLVTMIDRAAAVTRPDLDRVSEGVMANYRSHGGQILMAKTMQDRSGQPYNYMVAAFEEPAKRRYELNFVKMALGAKKASIVIYGVRITDRDDYVKKAKEFLTRESDGIGRALASGTFPDLRTLPRREF